MAAPEILRRRNRWWILLLAGAGASGYAAYCVYHLPSVARGRRRLAGFLRAAASVADAASSSSSAISLLSSDLNAFLRSDSDEVPQSLRQLFKISRSDEFSASVSRASEALAVGIVRGIGSNGPGFADRAVDRLFSAAGSGFASVVVGSFARNLVMAFFSAEEEGNKQRGGASPESSPPPAPRWLQVACGSKCRELIGDCIKLFVSTAVVVFLDKTAGTNTYQELFSGLTNPNHEAKVKEILVSLCNGAVETAVKTTHEVLTAAPSSDLGAAPPPRKLHAVNANHRKYEEQRGWMEKVSSTMAVPNNRKLVLDVTGRVTFETIRSLLDFMMRKLCENAMTAASFVHTELVERALEFMRYISAKSMAIVSVCLSLFMQYMVGTKLLTLS